MELGRKVGLASYSECLFPSNEALYKSKFYKVAIIAIVFLPCRAQ